MRTLLPALFASAALLLVAIPASAQDDDIVYQDQTEIDFEGVSVDGELRRPQGALIAERRTSTFNPLIQLRYDFDEEMYESVDEIK